MASGAMDEPCVSDFDEISCSCSSSNSEQINVCLKNEQALFKISHFEILDILGVFRSQSSIKFCRSSFKLFLLPR